METEQQKIFEVNNIFKEDYISSQALYMDLFNEIPNVNYLRDIDGEKPFIAIKEKFGAQIISPTACWQIF